MPLDPLRLALGCVSSSRASSLSWRPADLLGAWLTAAAPWLHPAVATACSLLHLPHSPLPGRLPPPNFRPFSLRRAAARTSVRTTIPDPPSSLRHHPGLGARPHTEGHSRGAPGLGEQLLIALLTVRESFLQKGMSPDFLWQPFSRSMRCPEPGRPDSGRADSSVS